MNVTITTWSSWRTQTGSAEDVTVLETSGTNGLKMIKESVMLCIVSLRHPSKVLIKVHSHYEVTIKLKPFQLLMQIKNNKLFTKTFFKEEKTSFSSRNATPPTGKHTLDYQSTKISLKTRHHKREPHKIRTNTSSRQETEISDGADEDKILPFKHLDYAKTLTPATTRTHPHTPASQVKSRGSFDKYCK